MTPRERLKAAVDGTAVDRVPFVAWHHFYLKPPAGPDSEMAAAELKFYNSFKPDLLKVMHDVPFEYLGEINTPEDWRSLPVVDPHKGNYALQLETLRQIRSSLDPTVPMVDTVFGVYATAFDISKGKIVSHLRENPEPVIAGLRSIAESIRRYACAALSGGCEGIFYALSGASAEGVSNTEYAEVFKPLDAAILGDVEDAPFNILHVHGYSDLYFGLVHDLPAKAINWSDRAGGPSLSDARSIHKGCIMGGIDEKRFDSMAPQQITNLARAAVAEAGTRSFILAPGCSVPDNTSTERLRAIREAVVIE
jgi:uroporphyrinogen decarboxylase